MTIDRRTMLLTTAATVTFAAYARAEARPRIDIYKSPACDCCDGWVGHLEGAGYTTKVFPTLRLGEIKANVGVPVSLQACHTAIMSDYLLEGHVPAEAIAKLLAERPIAKGGLAVPGMPVGSPGMEVPGKAPEEYDVMLFGDGEPRPYMRFRGGERI